MEMLTSVGPTLGAWIDSARAGQVRGLRECGYNKKDIQWNWATVSFFLEITLGIKFSLMSQREGLAVTQRYHKLYEESGGPVSILLETLCYRSTCPVISSAIT